MRRVLAGLLAVLLCVGLAACGGDDGTSTTTTTVQSGTTTRATTVTTTARTTTTTLKTIVTTTPPTKATTTTVAVTTTTAVPERPLIEKYTADRSQFLIVHYEGEPSLNLAQIMGFISEPVIVEKEIYDDREVSEADILGYIQDYFEVPEGFAQTLKASPYYNPETDKYTLTTDSYSATHHNTYVKAYEDLGNDEYMLYIRYGWWDPGEGKHDYFKLYKARVKLVDNTPYSTVDGIYGKGKHVKYHTFEEVTQVPASATLIQRDAWEQW